MSSITEPVINGTNSGDFFVLRAKLPNGNIAQYAIDSCTTEVIPYSHPKFDDVREKYPLAFQNAQMISLAGMPQQEVIVRVGNYKKSDKNGGMMEGSSRDVELMIDETGVITREAHLNRGSELSVTVRNYRTGRVIASSHEAPTPEREAALLPHVPLSDPEWRYEKLLTPQTASLFPFTAPVVVSVENKLNVLEVRLPDERTSVVGVDLSKAGPSPRAANFTWSRMEFPTEPRTQVSFPLSRHTSHTHVLNAVPLIVLQLPNNDTLRLAFNGETWQVNDPKPTIPVARSSAATPEAPPPPK